MDSLHRDRDKGRKQKTVFGLRTIRVEPLLQILVIGKKNRHIVHFKG